MIFKGCRIEGIPTKFSLIRWKGKECVGEWKKKSIGDWWLVIGDWWLVIGDWRMENGGDMVWPNGPMRPALRYSSDPDQVCLVRSDPRNSFRLVRVSDLASNPSYHTLGHTKRHSLYIKILHIFNPYSYSSSI